MSTHKSIDKVCIIITIIAVIVTALFMNAGSFGVSADDSVTMNYENSLFDDSYVHSIDISISDWDGFIDTATGEEYTAVDVTIDGETIKNVALRAKGNTSLSTVSQLGSERYSLKIEFDRFQDSTNYHGLDKLCLNNLIQDYTMMKDYIAYKLMGEFGVSAPLVSFVYVTVNGEDWGLFLAAEAVEESFLERNYGTNYGELYKPDSMGMGGGRGNGRDFDMRDMDFDQMGMKNPFERSDRDSDESDGESESEGENAEGAEASEDDSSSRKSKGSRKSEKSKGSDSSGKSKGSESSEKSKGSESSGKSKDSAGSEKSEGGDSSFAVPGGDMPDFGEMPVFGGDMPSGEFPSDFGGGMPDFSDGEMPDFGNGEMPGDFGGFGMGSSDVKLQYTDDDTDSYSTIFNSAKTPISTADKKRVIAALKNLNEGIAENDDDKIAEGIDIDAVLRYMVVHNFVVNSDSYTGNMIHNYYLYEEDGLLSMIPWDYNLAYGTFQGSGADSAVNDPIDNPLSITDGDTDRPMFSWIISSDEYTQMYHEYYEEFLQQFYTSGYLTDLIDSTYEMIYPYVEKDPTKFCEVSEFEKAVETIRSFVTLRFESIEGQLNGTIGSTDAAQSADPDALVDASEINISDMGSMGGGGGRGGSGGGPGSDRNKESSKSSDSSSTDSTSDSNASGDSAAESTSDSGASDASVSDDSSDNGFPGGGFNPGDFSGGPGGGFNPGGGFPGGDFGDFNPGEFGGFGGFSAVGSISKTNLIYLGVIMASLLAAILFARFYRNRR